MRNRPEQLTTSLIPWALKPHLQNSDLRLYDRFFTEAYPDAGGKDFLQSPNRDNLKDVTAYLEPSLAKALPDQKFRFERNSQFVAKRMYYKADKPVSNLRAARVKVVVA